MPDTLDTQVPSGETAVYSNLQRILRQLALQLNAAEQMPADSRYTQMYGSERNEGYDGRQLIARVQAGHGPR